MSLVPPLQNTGESARSLVDRLPITLAHERDELDGDLWVEVVERLEGPGGLLERVPTWDDLAEDAVEPNVFHESWQIIPAVRQFAPERMKFVFVYRRAKRPDVAPRLCGFFPFVESGGGITPRRWSLWLHDYCFLSSPLVRRGHTVETWQALMAYLSGHPAAPQTVDLPCVTGEGELAQSLIDTLFQRKLMVENIETHTRAMVKRSEDWTAYAGAAMSTHQRRELRRLWRRLSEQGDLEEKSLGPDQGTAVEYWINSFLHLEAQGWKGQAGSAVIVAEGTQSYFREIVRSAEERKRLQMFGLFLNGEPIAIKVNFLASPGSFAFKIAYDERYAKFSPGVQLELDNLRRLHETPDLEWMDSCAVPRHFMINRLWKERRTIQYLRISTGGVLGNLEVGIRTLLRSIRRSLVFGQIKLPESTHTAPLPTVASTQPVAENTH